MKIASPPPIDEALDGLDRRQLLAVVRHGGDPRREAAYPHWDSLRKLEPPKGLTSEQWWWRIKLQRGMTRRVLPLKDPGGTSLSLSLPELALQKVFAIEQRCIRGSAEPELRGGDELVAGGRDLVSPLVEEAIRSGQLAGATTSRSVAKHLLRTGRDPKDRHELLILNNYRALQAVHEAGPTLTPRHILELQRVLTTGGARKFNAAGPFQPPPRLGALCDFANAASEEGGFVHPVIRAILLHFWVADDRPFSEANRRLARALFYWSMRSRGYRLIEYISISRVLRKAQRKYSRSQHFAQTDDGDTTYFVIHQLEVIERAIDELDAYVNRKRTGIRAVEALVSTSADFNRRQLALLSESLRNPDRTYTYSGHARDHSVTHETARADLSRLVEAGLLASNRVSGRYYFTVPGDLAGALRRV